MTPVRLPLLVLLLALPLDVELLLLAAEFRCAFPLEPVLVDLEREIEGILIAHELPHGRERQLPALELDVLESFVLLVRPAHRPGELVPVLRNRQFCRQLSAADLVFAFPRPDRVRLLALRPRKAA